MNHDRRRFLKTTALAGAAAAGAAIVPAAGPHLAGAAENTGAWLALLAAPSEKPTGLTVATLQSGGRYVLGLRTDRGILNVAAAEREFREQAPTTMTALLAGRGDAAALARLTAKAMASATPDRFFVAEDKAAFGPAVTDPEKIICVGLNYRKHAAETGQPVPKMPILFNKFNSCLNRAGGTIAVSKIAAEKFDYESELVIVIGRKARNVGEEEAGACIFGYTAGHDFTARDLQSRSSQWMLGKACDGFAPVGPWLVTGDQVEGDNLKIETRVNGEVRQSSNTSDMVFNCRKLVSYASKYFTLMPGDLIFTGTPEGVIAGYPKDKQVWLKPGDRIVTTIEKLGELSFTLT